MCLAGLCALVAPLTIHAGQLPQPFLVRDTFVHYPHGFDVKPPSAGNGEKGALCPDPTTCPDYKLTRLAWPTAEAAAGIRYVIDPDGSALPESAVASAVTASFTTWSAAGAADADGRSISFVSDGQLTVINPSVSDAVNSIAWRDLSRSYPNAIAITYAWHYAGSKSIVEADTVFNSGAGFSWSTSGMSGAYDVQNIGTHEFGHWLQLGDLYKSQDAQLTMYGYGSLGETQKQTLGYGDILGAQKLY